MIAPSWANLASRLPVLSAPASARPLPVLVELGYPGGRTGCRDLAAAEAVARAVAQAGSLRLAGAAGYEGLIGRDRSPQTLGAIAAFFGAVGCGNTIMNSPRVR